MTSFIDFCRLHGVVIDQLPALGRWVRLPTTDKPRHRNGAVKWMGTYGFCQNWAEQTEPAVWRSEGESRIGVQRSQELAQQASRDLIAAQRRAAQKAEQMLSESELRGHPYLVAKGFSEERANVKGELLLIPMRVGRELVGVQIIDAEGKKKFLYGQRCSLAEFVFNAGGPHIVCEGYATALSVRLAMSRLKRPYTLHACFSAGNMKRVAETLPGGLVIADNDASGTGERTAQEIGWPYWMSDRVGEDANDAHQRLGLFYLSQGISKSLRRERSM